MQHVYETPTPELLLSAEFVLISPVHVLATGLMMRVNTEAEQTVC